MNRRNQNPTKITGFPSVRERLDHAERALNYMKDEEKQRMFMINALVWKLGCKSLDEVGAILTEFVAFKEKQLKEQAKPEAIEIPFQYALKDKKATETKDSTASQAQPSHD